MVSFHFNLILESALNSLQSFANLAGSDIRLQEIFGGGINPEPWLQAWKTGKFPSLPKLEVISSAEINGAKGAYGLETETIYLSQELLEGGNLDAATAVFLEEYGHYLDAQVNSIDTPGDEGQLFSAIARGIELTPEALASIQAEDDTTKVVIGGQAVTIEQAVTEVDAYDINVNGPPNLDDTASKVFVRGYYAYVVDGNGLTVFDVVGPTNPVPDGTRHFFAIPGARSVQVIRDYAYIGSNAGIHVISISDPSAMVQVDFVATSASVQSLWVDRERSAIFAALGNNGFDSWVVNINNPDTDFLTNLDNFNTAGFANDVYSVGDYAYVADGNFGLRILDVSTLNDPALADNAQIADEVGDYNTPGNARAVRVVGDYAYVADDGSGLQIINISNPSAPVFVGSFDTAGNAVDLEVVGPFAFVADGTTGVLVIDISDPTNPTLVETFDTPGNALGVQLVEDELFVADGVGGLRRLDVSEYTARNVTLSVSPDVVEEDGTDVLIYTFSLPKPAASDITVNFNIRQPVTLLEADTIASASDYSGVVLDANGNGTLTIKAGQSSATLRISPINDTLVEGPENVIVSLRTGTNYYPATNEPVIGTIISNTLPTISLQISVNNGLPSTNPVSVIENSGSPVTYTFTRSGIPQGRLTVYYTIGGTATGNDYTGAQPGLIQSLTFEDPETIRAQLLQADPNLDPELATIQARQIASVRTITITPKNNDVFEGNKTIEITILDDDPLFAPLVVNNYLVGTSNPVITNIIEDDPPIPQVFVTLDPIIASERGTETLVYTFSLSNAFNRDITINYTLAGTAGAGDYTGAAPGAGTVVITAGNTEATLIIDPVEDVLIEPDETVSLLLRTGNNYEIGTTDAVVGTIINSVDPATVTVSVSPASVTESGQDTMLFTFTMAEVAQNDTIIQYQIRLPASKEEGYTLAGLDDYANPGIDSTGKGTVTIKKGEKTAVVRISPVEDALVEYDESVGLSLLNGTGYVVGTTTPIVGTIISTTVPRVSLEVGTTSNPNPKPTDRIAIAENGNDKLVYTFKRSELPLGRLTVFYTVGGTATQDDYTGAIPGGVIRSFTFEDQNVIRDQILYAKQNGISYADLAADKIATLTADEITQESQRLASTYTLTITPTEDKFLEGDETVSISLGTGAYEIMTQGAIIGEILDDEANLPQVSLTVSPAEVIENGPNPLVYTFRLSSPADQDITINYNILDGTAIAQDFRDGSGNSTIVLKDSSGTRTVTPGGAQTLVIKKGDFEATITATPTIDGIPENTETLIVTLGTGNGYIVSTPDPVVGTVLDTTIPTVTVSLSPTSVNEDGTQPLVYTFTLSDAVRSDTTINYSLAGTASASDYTGATPGNRTLVIAAGQTTGTVTITPVNDLLVEGDETVSLTLGSGTGYIVGTSNPVVGTIVDNEPTVTVSLSPTSVNEDGTQNLVYIFTLSNTTNADLTINYSLGGSASGVDDYTTSGTVVIAAGQTQGTLVINPTADILPEENETVELTLGTGTGYIVGTNTPVVGTIVNDDGSFPELSLSVTPGNVAEDGNKNLVYTFLLSAPAPTGGITVNYTVSGTALASDYTGVDSLKNAVTPGINKTIVIAAGDSQASVTIDPQADNLTEGDETVILTLGTGNGYVIKTPDPVVGTINDSVGVTPVTDPTVTLSVSPSIVTETGNSVLVYTFSLQQRAEEDITVKYKIRVPERPEEEELIASPSDYNDLGPVDADGYRTVVIKKDTSSATVRISPNNDQLVERDEIVEVTLAPQDVAVGYTVGTTDPVVGTIISDDIPSISLRVSASTDPNPTFTDQVNVSETGSAQIFFTFTRSQLPLDRLTVFYDVGGTASNPQDYTGALSGENQTVTFEDVGVVRERIARENPTWTLEQVEVEARLIASTQTIAVTVVDDLFFEGDETIAFLLKEGAGYTLGTPIPVVANILDNELPLPEVSLSVTPESVLEDSTGTLIYTFALSTAAPKDLTINYTISGTADAQDYTGATPGGGKTILIKQGQTSGTLVIDPTNDTAVEADETVSITLGRGDGYLIPTVNNPVIGTIANDDILVIPQVSLTVAPTRILENSTQGMVYTFNLSAPVQNPLTINYSIGGTAGIQDYTGATPGGGKTITIGAGSTQGTLVINPIKDTLAEPDETVEVTLGNGNGYSVVTTNPVVGTIVNYTVPPSELLNTSFFRFQNMSKPGTYLFAGEQEAASIRKNYLNFREEGFAFKAASEKTDPLMQPFYRFRNTSPGLEGTYLFAGEQEAVSIRRNYRNFVDEGVAFFAYNTGFGQGTTDYARFNNKALNGSYLFAGPSETTGLVVGMGVGSVSHLTYEGLAFAALG